MNYLLGRTSNGISPSHGVVFILMFITFELLDPDT